MAIERMKLLSIVGKEENLESFIANYLLDSGLQPEEADKVYEKAWKLTTYGYDTRVRDELKNSINLLNDLNVEYEKNFKKIQIENTVEQISEEISAIRKEYEKSINTEKIALKRIQKLNSSYQLLIRLENIDIDFNNIREFRYIKSRYGKVNKKYFAEIELETKNMNVILIKIDEDEENIWFMYFTTREFEEDIDSYFNMMKFERIWLPEEIRSGKPKETILNITNEIKKYDNIINKERAQREELKINKSSRLLYLYRQLATLEKVDSIKKYLVHDNKGNFYIIGWIPESELKDIEPKLKQEKDIKYEVKQHDEVATDPPTHLKNNKLFNKFESIVEMYGVPNYNEIDPTKFVAITAFLMFGFMFGDVGQGLIIMLIGIFLLVKKKSLGPVFTAAGISAMIFGVLYGSIFGKEDIIPSLLIKPMENISTMLIAGITFGVILIFIAMITNILNGIKNRDIKKIFFSENGIAGFIFYALILSSIVYYFLKGRIFISGGILACILAICLIMIAFKEQLSNIIKKNKLQTKSSIVEIIFEIVEMLLSMVSNTISFVRLAAFAINHVGLCLAVYILANMTSGTGSLAIAIIGNTLVIVLEGLVVAIQVLRLEYYELFSKFYSGDGRHYKPIKEQSL
jgi:V/A-type H+-transporting ATPase subunit I